MAGRMCDEKESGWGGRHCAVEGGGNRYTIELLVRWIAFCMEQEQGQHMSKS